MMARLIRALLLAPLFAVGCSASKDDSAAVPASDLEVGTAETAAADSELASDGLMFDVVPHEAAVDSASADAADATVDAGEDVAIEAAAETEADSAPLDTGVEDTGVVDTSVEDTGPFDTGPDDTGPFDTGPFDTGSPDTGPFDTGSLDTGPFDTGAPDTGPFDTGPDDTGVVDTTPLPDPPTVKVTLPAANTSIAYDKTTDACQGRRFAVSFVAPAGLKSLQWKFFTPDATKATTAMVGTCTGGPAYGYFADATFAGSTGATFEEDVAIAGIYTGTAGSGRWWWCTPPGSSTTSSVDKPPAPGTPGVQTLSNYCYAKSTPPSTDLGSQWRLEVTVVDAFGRSAVSNLAFWVHQ